jgi:hypothetical protein
MEGGGGPRPAGKTAKDLWRRQQIPTRRSRRKQRRPRSCAPHNPSRPKPPDGINGGAERRKKVAAEGRRGKRAGIPQRADADGVQERGEAVVTTEGRGGPATATSPTATASDSDRTEADTKKEDGAKTRTEAPK